MKIIITLLSACVLTFFSLPENSKPVTETVKVEKASAVQPAAGLDTVYIRQMVLKFEEWCWLKGNWAPTGTLQKKFWKKMKTAITAVQNPTDGTLIPVDSVPGEVGVQWFGIFQGTDKGVTKYMSNDNNNAAAKIQNYPPILPYTNPIDTAHRITFKNAKANGKDDFDN